MPQGTEQNQDGQSAPFGEENRQIGRVYAEALYNAAAKQNQAREVLEELEALVAQVFRRDPRLEEFLASPAVSREHKATAIRDAFAGRANGVFVNFLLVLNEHDRLGTLRAVAALYRELFDDRAGRMRVFVQSAVPLPEDQQDRLRHELRALYNHEPVLETRVDPDLLGGLVVRVGDWLYDGSVSSRLETIRDQLIERSSHEIQSRRDRFSS
jgi:F-type H+-transporting ATPase subunit delta